MEGLWRQHTQEMEMMEGNALNVCGQQCTVEFQQSADQSWQGWANNELNQAATYPSRYANVHKGELCKMGGSIGNSDDCTWQVPHQDNRIKDLEKLETFNKSLPKQLSESKSHSRVLELLASDRLQQLGEPRNGELQIAKA